MDERVRRPQKHTVLPDPWTRCQQIAPGLPLSCQKSCTLLLLVQQDLTYDQSRQEPNSMTWLTLSLVICMLIRIVSSTINQ